MTFGFFTTGALQQLLGSMGAGVRYGFGFWVPGLAAFLFFAYKSGRNWLAGISLVFMGVLSLAGLWINASNEIQVLGGFLYFSDAAQYYADALRLLEYLPISAFSARHPLPTLFLGFWLWLVNGDLQWALLVLAVLGALCIFVAASSLARADGYLGASLLATALFLFYRRFIGLPNSEQLGLGLGCLSLAFMLQAAVTENAKAGLVGLFLLGLGIAARPGTFLILIVALLWFAGKRSITGRKRLANLCLGLVAVSMGIILTFLCNILLAEKGSTAFSNYSYSLYGIARGGLGWELFSVEHPETLSMPPSQAEAIAFRESLISLRTDPLLGLQGWMNSYVEYFALGPTSIFGFFAGAETASFGEPESRSLYWVYVIVRLLLYFLSLLGIRALWHGRDNPVCSLLLWAAVGALVGLAFIPARDAGMMRVHAVSLPYLLCLPAAGFTFVFRSKPRLIPVTADHRWHEFLAGALVLSIFATPIVLSGHSPVQANTMTDCNADEIAMIVRLNRGDHLHILEDAWMGDPPLSYLRYSAFRKKIQQFHQSILLNDLAKIQPNNMLMMAIDLRTGQLAWLTLPTSAEQLRGYTIEVCGKWNPGLLAKGLGVLDVKHFYLLPSQS